MMLDFSDQVVLTTLVCLQVGDVDQMYAGSQHLSSDLLFSTIDDTLAGLVYMGLATESDEVYMITPKGMSTYWEYVLPKFINRVKIHD